MATSKPDPYDEKPTGAKAKAKEQPRRVFEVDRSGTARTSDEDEGKDEAQTEAGGDRDKGRRRKTDDK
ncbi:hypothetical protein ACIQNU_05355 [Streptomyces sp. NPDC091292]|uniref:hypothetical protein n=1 Tax=Streptomyces sp. NPDC091292 TaxID=3365991 RepID=UPI00381CB4AC